MLSRLTSIELQALHRLVAVSGEVVVIAATHEPQRLAIHEFMERVLAESNR